jgi:hypothetical protein
MIEKIIEYFKTMKLNTIIVYNVKKNVTLKKTTPFLKYNFEQNNNINKYLDILLKSNNEKENKFILKNLESLRIKNRNSSNNTFYMPNKNIIYLGKDKKDSLPHELLHVASTYVTKDVTYTGFCQITKNEEIGRGINEGFTELFSKDIFKEKNKFSAYSLFEVDVAKEIIKLLNYDEIKSLYFNADLISLLRLLKKYDSSENIVKFVKDVDYITNNINKKDTSQKMKEVYICLYKWNAIKLKELYDNDIITKKQYEDEILNNNKIYPARMLISLGVSDPIPKEIKNEVRRIII